MASTYRPIDAFDYAKNFIKKMPLEQVSAGILDAAIKHLWMAAPWRWTIGDMPTASIAANTTDYTIVDPGDFLHLQGGRLTDGVGYNRPLTPVSHIVEPVTQPGQPTQLAHNTNKLIVYPAPTALPSGQTITLLSSYKKQAPSITATNQYTAGVQIIDDEWFWVFQEDVLWRAFLYSEDGRAGSIQLGPSGPTYSGQRAVVEDALNFMRQSEPLLVVDPLVEQKRDRG